MSFQLTPDEHKALLAAQPAIRDLEKLIQLAEEAGLDLSAEKAELERRKNLVYGFLRVFRPSGGRSPVIPPAAPNT